MLPLAEKKSYYTYADVLEWDEDVRAEIIDGGLYMMTSDAEASNKSFLAANGPKVRMAPPARVHQMVLMELARQLGNFLQGKSCEVYPAPFGVRLFPKDDQSDDTFVEPDIVVVCDSSKLDDKGCNGAPDLAVEILSSSTARYDRVVKLL
jgi:Uma2 family endonuclease